MRAKVVMRKGKKEGGERKKRRNNDDDDDDDNNNKIKRGGASPAAAPLQPNSASPAGEQSESPLRSMTSARRGPPTQPPKGGQARGGDVTEGCSGSPRRRLAAAAAAGADWPRANNGTQNVGVPGRRRWAGARRTARLLLLLLLQLLQRRRGSGLCTAGATGRREPAGSSRRVEGAAVGKKSLPIPSFAGGGGVGKTQPGEKNLPCCNFAIKE